MLCKYDTVGVHTSTILVNLLSHKNIFTFFMIIHIYFIVYWRELWLYKYHTCKHILINDSLFT